MSSYSDFANASSDILLHKGDVLARAKEKSGELIGGTIANLGQVIPQQVQQAIKDAAAKRKTAQIQGILQRNGGDLEKSIPLIMGVDATIGEHLLEQHAKVQESIAKAQELKQNAAKAQLDFSDRLWSQVSDEGSYAHAALVDKALGGTPLDHYDPEWVKQKKQSLLSLKDQLDANKPIVVPRGGTLTTPQGTVLAKGEAFPAPQPTEAAIALQASGGDPAAAMDRLKPPPDKSITPYQQAEIDRQNRALAEQGRHNKVMEARPVSGSTAGAADDVKVAVQGMKEGTIPPQLPGRASKEYLALLAEAKRQGYDLATAATDWQATQKHVATLNGAQQTRMAQAIDNASHSLDVIDDLATQWNGGKFPILNRATLAAAKNGAMGAKAQQIATNLEAQISDVTSELGNVYMGGNSPTDHALGLASKNLSADWTQAQLKSAIELARKNLTIRQNSMRNVGVAGASAANPYAPTPAVAPPTGRYNPKTGKVE